MARKKSKWVYDGEGMKRIPWEKYTKRSIKDAVKGVPEPLGDLIVRAFNAAHCMDIYGGDLKQYLTVIAQQLESKSKQLEILQVSIADLAKRSKDLWTEVALKAKG